MVKSKQTAGSAGTREALLLAGERLIAEFGIDAVSLRQINTEAGQRNSSAAHYHFGSKDALVRAIFDYRMEHVNQRRSVQLAEAMERSGGNPEPRRIVETIVNPIVEEISNSEGGSAYIRFLSQAVGHPQTDTNDYSTNLLDAASRAFQHLREALPEIPESILSHRFGLMWIMIIHSLADRERKRDRLQRPIPVEDQALFVSNLIDTATGALMADVDKQTLKQLSRKA